MICTLWNMLTIPNWFEVRIGKPEIQHILNRVLSQKVIDPKYVFFRKGAMHYLIESVRGGQIVTKWFFDDNPTACSTSRRTQLFYDLRKQNRWNRQVMQRMLRRTELLPQLGERAWITVIAVDVLQS